MQGPTVSPVFCKRDGRVSADYYAIVICVPKKALYKSVQQLRAVSLIMMMKLIPPPLYSMRIRLLYIPAACFHETQSACHTLFQLLILYIKHSPTLPFVLPKQKIHESEALVHLIIVVQSFRKYQEGFCISKKLHN